MSKHFIEPYPLPDGPFSIIIADPPWRFKTHSDKGRSRSPDGPLGHYSSRGRVLGLGASHASPRAHWRRGHIRTIYKNTPKQKRITIPATLINGLGFVSKDYEVSPPQSHL